MHSYIYARDLGKKHEKKAIFQAYFLVKKSIYAPKKSVPEILGHTLDEGKNFIFSDFCFRFFAKSPRYELLTKKVEQNRRQ